MTQKATSQSALASPVQAMDQDVQALVEQKLQALVDLLETHDCTYWKGWLERVEAMSDLPYPYRLDLDGQPPQHSRLCLKLDQIQESLSPQDQEDYPFGLLHSILGWYMNLKYARPFLSVKRKRE